MTLGMFVDTGSVYEFPDETGVPQKLLGGGEGHGGRQAVLEAGKLCR